MHSILYHLNFLKDTSSLSLSYHPPKDEYLFELQPFYLLCLQSLFLEIFTSTGQLSPPIFSPVTIGHLLASLWVDCFFLPALSIWTFPAKYLWPPFFIKFALEIQFGCWQHLLTPPPPMTKTPPPQFWIKVIFCLTKAPIFKYSYFKKLISFFLQEKLCLFSMLSKNVHFYQKCFCNIKLMVILWNLVGTTSFDHL